jgi:polyisoprenoid-binding protein YceI
MTKTSRSMFVGTSLLAAVLTLSAAAYAKLSKTGDATAGFHASGPGGLAIDGKTSEVAVKDDGTNVTVTVTLGNIDTGMSLRNGHTKEDLEVTTFPSAKLTVARSELKIPADGADSSGDAKGTLTIHGQPKEDVKFHYTANNKGGTISVKGSTTIKVSDYGVKPRSYLSISIKNEVDVWANFQVTDG